MSTSGNSFNLNNQLTGTSLGYDGNGNPTLYGNSSVSFNPDNKATALGTALNADYGAAGLRAWKQPATGTTPPRSYYLYDGAFPVLEWNASTGDTFIHTFGVSGLIRASATAKHRVPWG